MKLTSWFPASQAALSPPPACEACGRATADNVITVAVGVATAVVGLWRLLAARSARPAFGARAAAANLAGPASQVQVLCDPGSHELCEPGPGGCRWGPLPCQGLAEGAVLTDDGVGAQRVGSDRSDGSDSA